MTTPKTPAQTLHEFVAERRAIRLKATPGEWHPCLGSGMNECTAIAGNTLVCDLVPDWMLDYRYKEALEYKPANMDAICDAHNNQARLEQMVTILAEALEEVAKQDTCSTDTGPDQRWLTDWRNRTKRGTQDALTRAAQLAKEGRA